MGYGLDACCNANGIGSKTGNGALAPIDWQQGRIGSVIDYCLQDIKLTEQLFRIILGYGWILNPNRQSEDFGKRITLDIKRAHSQLYSNNH